MYRQPIINHGLSEFRSVVFDDEILVQTLTASQTKTRCVLTNQFSFSLQPQK